MTDRRRRPGPLAVVSAAAATFLTILILLAAQLHAGHDPVLGASSGGRALTRSPAPAADPPTAPAPAPPPVTKSS